MQKLTEIIAQDEEAILIELAEESFELAQAAIKTVRVHCGRSPADEERVRGSLIEEMADVQVMLGAVREMLTPAEVLRMRSTIKYIRTEDPRSGFRQRRGKSLISCAGWSR